MDASISFSMISTTHIHTHTCISSPDSVAFQQSIVVQEKAGAKYEKNLEREIKRRNKSLETLIHFKNLAKKKRKEKFRDSGKLRERERIKNWERI